MTSHKEVFDERSRDELGGLIRWALKESVVDASPPPDAWGRIRRRAERWLVWERITSHFGMVYRATAAQLSRVNAFFLALIVSWIWPRGRWGDWRFDPYASRVIFEQYGFFTLLRLAF